MIKEKNVAMINIAKFEMIQMITHTILINTHLYQY